MEMEKWQKMDAWKDGWINPQIYQLLFVGALVIGSSYMESHQNE